MFCNYCGSPNPDDSRFCSKCGRSVFSSAISKIINAPNPPDETDAFQQAKEIKPTTIGGFAATYSHMLDDELLHLLEQKETLTPDARIAMDAEIQKRGLTPDLNSAAEVNSTSKTPSPLDSDTSALPDASRREQLKRKIRWKQVWLWFSVTLLILTLFSAPLQKGEKPRNIAPIALLFIAIWVYRERKRLSSVQNVYYALEVALGNSRAERDAKALRVLLSTLAVLLCVVALASGVYISRRAERGRVVISVEKELQELHVASKQNWERLTEIIQRETPTWDDYVQQKLEVEELLDEADPQLARIEQLHARLREAFGADFDSLPTVDISLRFSALEKELRQLLRDEIAHAKKLAKLPESQKEDYYDTYIFPIQQEQERLANDQMELLRRLKGQGVDLPSHLDEFLKEEQ